MGKGSFRLVFLILLLLFSWSVMANLNVKNMYQNLVLYSPNLLAERVFSKVNLRTWRLRKVGQLKMFKEDVKILKSRIKSLFAKSALTFKVKRGNFVCYYLKVGKKFYFFHPILGVRMVKTVPPFASR